MNNKSLFTDVVTCNCHFLSHGWNCTSCYPALTASATKIIHTVVQLLSIGYCLCVVQNTAEEGVFLYESRVKHNSPRKCWKKFH
jgi:hypothetical protein